MEPKDVLFFDKMLTPTIIVVVYWLILAAAVVGGLVTMFTSSFLTGLLALIGGVLFGRIWCELLIVLFKMNDALQTLKNR
jgi:hypothetical protein